MLGPGQTLVEIVVRQGSELIGETVESAKFGGEYPAAVLAVQRGGEKMYSRLAEVEFEAGDVLLIESTEETVEQLADNPNINVASELQLQPFRSEKMPIALATIAGIVGLVVSGVGGYNFSDFFRVGFPLQLVCWVTTVSSIWVIWGV